MEQQEYRHYIFLRDYNDHTVLVASNFSGKDAHMNIVIPDHAFEWMGIPVTSDLYPGKTIEIKVGPMNGTLIQLI